MKILIIEDEIKLARALARGLNHEGYVADIVPDGKKALSRLSLHRNDYEVVILDLMLPSLDGYEICKQARELGVTTPILVLTARAEMESKVRALEAGADDYLVKPFSFVELLARVRALVRRPRGTMTPEILKGAGLELNVTEHRVTRDGKEIHLTLKEFNLLEYFLRHPNEVVQRDDLLTHLWDFNYVGFSNVVDVHIKNLRRKLMARGGKDVLETVRGIGYRLAR